MSEALWRVGRKVGRTIYIGDALVGMMDTERLAKEVVEALNRRADTPDMAAAHEASVWRNFILFDKRALALWEDTRGDRDEFSADDAAMLVKRLLDQRDTNMAALRKVREEMASLYWRKRHFGYVVIEATIDKRKADEWLAVIDAILEGR